jgi:undecaprenyl phosphate-alpha-L-ara4N flippase subunit ArnF
MTRTTESSPGLAQDAPVVIDQRPLSLLSQWFAIVLVLLNALLSTVAEVFLKMGAIQLPTIILPPPFSFVSIIFSWWVMLGIFAYICSLSLWLLALPHLPLHLAFGLSSTVHLLVPIACCLILHEIIPLGRCLGMIFILAGALTLGFSNEKFSQDDRK